MQRVSISRVLICALLSLLLVGIGFGQETTGSIRGIVMDQTGAAIPGATVALTGGTVSMTMTTDEQGAFRFAKIPAGTGYTVSITAQGFRNARNSGLAVELGKATTMEMRLEVGSLTETVEVAAEAVMVDTQSSSSAITVDKSFFDVIPKGRSFFDLIGVAPGARSEGKTAGSYQIDGASGAENTFYLDGMEMEDIQGGTLSTQNRLPVEMIQQVEIKNGIMDAQYGGAMGGVVNAVVRSGSKDYHGQAGFYWSGDSLWARPRPALILDPNDDGIAIYKQEPQDSFNRWNPVFNLGGPILKNKLFFFAGYMPQRNDFTRTVNYNTGEVGTYGQTFTQQFLSSKLDFVPTSKIRVNMSWIWNPYKTQGVLPSRLGTDSFDNNWGDQGDYMGNQMINGQIDYLASAKLILSFRGGYTYSGYNNMYGIPAGAAIYYSGDSTTVPPAGLQGPNGWVKQAVAATTYDQNRRTNLNADASYMVNFHGQHSLKGGWQMNRLSNDVLSSDYPYGYYRYYWGSTYFCQNSTCQGTGPYGYYRYRVYGEVGAASSNNQGMFLQDNWRVNSRLSLNLGIRAEHEFVPSFTTGGATASPAITFDWAQKLSPRVGVAFDPKGDGKQRIYAGFGYFYDVMKYSLPRSSFGGNVWKEYFYTLDDPNLVNTLQTMPADPTKLPGSLIETVDYRIPSNDPSQHLIDPNLKPMKQRMIDLGYDYTIRPSLIASVRYTDRRLLSAIEDVGHLTPEGEVYNIANPGRGIVANSVDGIPGTPKPVRNYDAVEFRLDKRFSSNFQFSASYTWSRLYGNYGGLSSSDESGGWFGDTARDNPNNSRYFDEPWIYGDSHGKIAMGRLPTDRPHSLKFFGGYTLKSKLGSTTFSPNIMAYSGSPLSSDVQLVDTQAWMYFNGRGDMGRTPFFYQFDANVMHEFAPFKNHESMKVRLEASVFNMLNSSIVTDRFNLYSHQIDGVVQVPDGIASIFSKGVDVKALMATQGIRVDPEYGKADIFQGPRNMRFQLSFFF